MKRTDADYHLNNQFQSGNPLTGQRGTRLEHTWLNSVQEEIAGAIEAAGIALDPGDDGQLAGAVRKLALASFATLATATATAANGAAMLPADVQTIQIKGHTVEGRGGAQYKRVDREPTHNGKFQDASGQWWQLNEFHVLPEMFGAVSDGVADDTAAIQAAVDFACNWKTKLLLEPQAPYRVSDTIRITRPIQMDGQLAQVYQQTPNTDLFHFDRGVTGNANFQYTYNVCNIIGATVAGTGDAFVFRNTLESTFKNLYCPGVGNAAFRVSGCLLSSWGQCYSGTGLNFSPGFFVSGLPVNKYGFYLESRGGLACNSCHLDRCTATNSTVDAFHVTGNNIVLTAPDAEGIHAPAVHMRINGFATNVNGGNFEGNGSGVIINGDNCRLTGATCLTPVVIATGVTGVTVEGGQARFMTLQEGSANNSLRNVRISDGGALQNLGIDNEIRNVRTFDGVEIGNHRSGTFTPTLKFGGADALTSYHQRKGRWALEDRMLTVELRVQANAYTAATGSTSIVMDDLPFVVAADAIHGICEIWTNNIAPGAGFTGIRGLIVPGGKTITFNKASTSSGGNFAVDNTAWGASAAMFLKCTFRI